MEVKSCYGCGRLFQYISGSALCPECKKKEEDMFQRVRKYLMKKPGASLYELNRETEVSVVFIEKFIREGRIQVAQESPIRLTCEKCGEPIRTGKLCDTCKKKLMDNINKLKTACTPLKEEEESVKAKMRTMRRYSK